MKRSTKIGVDMPPTRLARALCAAVGEGMSLNSWIEQEIDKAALAYIRNKKPDIVYMGDFWDMPSLTAYADTKGPTNNDK